MSHQKSLVTKPFSAFDHTMMARALKLAKKGLYSTDPNPRVGCVLVKDGKVVGEGFHLKAGQAHAEVNALNQAGKDAQGATAYVTLEPCSHFGRTPPCSEGLIKAGVREVVAAMQDPNPLVAGQGFAKLQAAGIEVRYGLMQKQAKELNIGFVKRMSEGRPWVRIKVATSVDGRTAMLSGESKWITGSYARMDVQRLRARSSAIITGIGTVLHDDASLNVRERELGLAPDLAKQASSRQPLRVLLDRNAQLPENAAIIQAAGNLLWCVKNPDDARVERLLERHANIEVFSLPGDDSQAQLETLIRELASRSCNEVLVEAGAKLAGAFICAGLYDELFVYMAPKLLGSAARPLAEIPIHSMDQALDLSLKDIRMVGEDMRMVYLKADK